jgi:hypothetical protein
MQSWLRDMESVALVAACDREVACSDACDDTNLSVLGVEDSGSALDLLVPATDGAQTWCPWPRERSA